MKAYRVGSLTLPRCKIGAGLGLENWRLTLWIIMRKWEQRVGDDGSTLVLKPNWSPKQRAPVAPQNGDLSPQKFEKKKYWGLSSSYNM